MNYLLINLLIVYIINFSHNIPNWFTLLRKHYF